MVPNDNSSLTPYLVVNQFEETSSLEDSMRRAMESSTELVLFKLIANHTLGHVGLGEELFVFTNRRIILLSYSQSLWGVIWKVLGAVEKIPVIGWLLSYVIDIVSGFFNKIFKRRGSQYDALMAVGDDAICSVTRYSKVAKKIKAMPLKHSQFIQPSMGVSIKYNPFSLFMFRFNFVSVRFIAVGRLRQNVSSLVKACEMTLPNPAVLPKLVPVINAISPYLPTGYSLNTSNDKEIKLEWSSDIGVGSQLWSVYLGTAMSIFTFLACLMLFVVALSEEEGAIFFFTIFIFYGAIMSYAIGRSLSQTFVWSFIFIAPLLAILIPFLEQL